MTITPIFDPANGAARVAAFMSGSGTNVQKVLELEQMLDEDCPWQTVVLVTDNPEGSNTRRIAGEYHLPSVELDIRQFYRDKGFSQVRIRTTPEQKAREEYSSALKEKLSQYEISLGVFGGFEPLVNIVAGVQQGRVVRAYNSIPCLNIHPGDLTIKGEDGRRLLVGLHEVPIQKSIDGGWGHFRSTCILATPYSGAGENMDDGPILGLGPELRRGYETDAEKIQERLKEVSDWKVFPRTIYMVASGKLGLDESNKAWHMKGNRWEQGPIGMPGIYDMED